MAQLPRGIAPDLLVSQVKNTMPYLFGPEVSERPLGRFAPAQVVREFEVDPSRPLSHFEYFRLCLSSHYLSCGTPVPTDVDNQIRQKLWPKQLPLEVAIQMASLVLESRKWDFTQVTTRYIFGAKGTAWEKELLAGHLGEWFTVACGAYCAMKQYADGEAERMRASLLEAIADEVHRHSEIFASLWKAGDGIGALKACSSLAHNFGDLDRVMDMWELGVEDPLRLQFYKLAHSPYDPNRKLRFQGRLWIAGELYKAQIEGSSMALENHRHYALRKPRSLRKNPAFLVPTAPFFDDWGRNVARGLAAEKGKPSEETLEIVETLAQGWERQPKSVGYGRGLCGILEVHPELRSDELTKDPQRKQLLKTSQAAFERKWNDAALRELEDIPSRAQ